MYVIEIVKRDDISTFLLLPAAMFDGGSSAPSTKDRIW